MSFISEFKQFAMRGNVVDLAVAVVIGSAFSKIVSSLVDGIIMPFLGLLLGGIDITDKVFKIGDAVIKWGAFLQSIFDFTLVAFAVFIVIRFINLLQKKQEDEPVHLSNQEKILLEIKELLASNPSRKDN
ncbi:large conductance mechanosensitive channel, MscL family [Legionella beliardensis]|uniref:Large-conductance mechanosensitive channel n=1 Tax=Legionella beliardensis TaxID=91822 RepID=A0A378I2W2_9GAMM|nr:large conductance mechanosensitive channel protein MscL [Legionella beliardensis]STX29498.1 large conductance mechanosensitive channel, MscL family [Legionella beliardensis]